jgi:hypothetical protein
VTMIRKREQRVARIRERIGLGNIREAD